MMDPIKPNPFKKQKNQANNKAEADLREELLEKAKDDLVNKQIINEESVLWREFLPVYCLMNAAMYYGHRHTPDGPSMDMPNGEEEAHNILCWLFSGAFLFFAISTLHF